MTMETPISGHRLNKKRHEAKPSPSPSPVRLEWNWSAQRSRWGVSASKEMLLFSRSFQAYPLVMKRSYWTWPIYSWFTKRKWWFSVVTLNDQRVVLLEYNLYNYQVWLVYVGWICINPHQWLSTNTITHGLGFKEPPTNKTYCLARFPSLSGFPFWETKTSSSATPG